MHRTLLEIDFRYFVYLVEGDSLSTQMTDLLIFQNARFGITFYSFALGISSHGYLKDIL